MILDLACMLNLSLPLQGSLRYLHTARRILRLSKMLLKPVIALAALCFAPFTAAQLATGYQLGPVTTSDAKWAVKVCDVTKYGAVADMSTDLGPPLLAAFNACKNGGIGM